MNLTKQQITEIANNVGLDYPSLAAFISVESGGKGFNDDGKIIIQFEPVWMHRYLIQFKIPHSFTSTIDSKGRHSYTISAGGKSITNGVEGQTTEWISFNTAFAIHPKAALLSTSIGLMQIMGFNHTSVGYDTVDEMWDDFKKGEYQQVEGGARFIKNNSALYNALINKEWIKVAYHYNGSNYAVNNYDKKLAAAYKKYSI